MQQKNVISTLYVYFFLTQYRDRAKERRDKYGIPPPPEPRHKRPDLPVP